MIPLTPSFLIAAASSLVGVREEGGNNRGHMIERFLQSVNQPPGQPWCAAFVHHVGYWSHFDYEQGKSSWPLPATASCYMLGLEAKKRGVLHEEPEEGDVFVLWNSQLVRFAHTGIVARVRDEGETMGAGEWYECDTIEGNTDVDGGREGDGVMRRVRRFYPRAGDRFVRWVDLDRRSLVGQVTQSLPSGPTSKVA
jgi:hypothetical protein